uniref:Uncharacterized protein n=1 Tax=Opuntia streptacantha TaxID=393608 RepID=A0A7C9AKC0_OPUST
MSNALVKLIFGCMMMADMKRKARIKLEGIFGRRLQLGSSVHYSLCQFPKVNLISQMTQTILLEFRNIWNRREFRSCCFLDLRDLEPARYSSRVNQIQLAIPD